MGHGELRPKTRKKEEAMFVRDRRTDRQRVSDKNNRLLARRGDQKSLDISCLVRHGVGSTALIRTLTPGMPRALVTTK